jgi:hypothetical protein
MGALLSYFPELTIKNQLAEVPHTGGTGAYDNVPTPVASSDDMKSSIKSVKVHWTNS